jgi:Thioesterase-like superfamily
MDETAYYLPLGDDIYQPTRATESPWDTRAQHGGPPTALLGHLLSPGGDLRLARISMDFLGPIPRREFRIEVSPLKPGRLTYLSEARMVVDGKVAVTARGWHIASGPKPPVETEARMPPPLPAAPPDQHFFAGLENWGYGESIEWRFNHGGFGATGPAGVWTRVRLPLLDGEEITGQARALLVADSANGLSAELPMTEWLSIPPTMTTTLLRPADGEWVHLACHTELTTDGLGLSHGDLYDTGGHLGEVSQPLLVRRR